MKKLFLIVPLTCLLWFGANSISLYVNEKAFPAKKSGEALNTLKQQSEVEPENKELKLKLAESYIQQFTITGNSKLVFSAIDTYNSVLQLDSKNSAALVALAKISFESGANAKAIEYFERYLELNPKDYQLKNDLGLALIQNKDSARAIQVFSELEQEDPGNFGTSLGLALAYKTAESFELAKKQAEKTLEMAEDTQQKTVVTNFISSLKIASDPKLSELENYFKFHQIIGPKLKQLRWISDTQLQVILNDFPIDAMPEVARQSFLSKTKSRFLEIDKRIEIKVFDSAMPEKTLDIDLGLK